MSTKAQAWYMDFAIALLIFIFTLIVYFSYTTNVQKQEKGSLEVLIRDSNTITSSLILNGYPTNWDNKSVVRIGLANEQKLNITKVKLFKILPYATTKKLFATSYDYYVFFLNDKDEVLNINGVCGVGSPLVVTSYKIKSAYYFSDDTPGNGNNILKNFMSNTFHADIYFGDNPQDLDDIDSLMSNISKYSLLIMEKPSLSDANYIKYKDKLENFSSSGGLLIISDEFSTIQGQNLAGADFFKKPDQSIYDRNSTVNMTDKYLSLAARENIVFSQAYYVVNTTASLFQVISSFNADNSNAIAKWKFGNGTVYFFSDFDVSYYNGDFLSIVEEAVKGLVEGTCYPINITNLNQKSLVKSERYIRHNSKVAKMVIYLWQ